MDSLDELQDHQPDKETQQRIEEDIEQTSNCDCAQKKPVGYAEYAAANYCRHTQAGCQAPTITARAPCRRKPRLGAIQTLIGRWM
jgi:hypothetical protein